LSTRRNRWSKSRVVTKSGSAVIVFLLHTHSFKSACTDSGKVELGSKPRLSHIRLSSSGLRIVPHNRFCKTACVISSSAHKRPEDFPDRLTAARTLLRRSSHHSKMRRNEGLLFSIRSFGSFKKSTSSMSKSTLRVILGSSFCFVNSTARSPFGISTVVIHAIQSSLIVDLKNSSPPSSRN